MDKNRAKKKKIEHAKEAFPEKREGFFYCLFKGEE